MKRYKLLKDTPTVKAGAIFEEEGGSYDKKLVQVVADGHLFSHWVVVRDIINFNYWFEKIQEPKRWRGEYGETYWFLSDNGSLYFKTEDNSKIDNYRYLVGNYFKTIEEAKAYKKYLLARQVLLDDAEGGKFVLDNKNWTGYYVYGINRWLTQIVPQYYPGLIYFRSRKALEKSLEEHKEQWEIVRKYEMWEL